MVFKMTLILTFSIYPICHQDRSKEPVLVYAMAHESELCRTMAGSERTKRKEGWGGLKNDHHENDNSIVRGNLCQMSC